MTGSCFNVLLTSFGCVRLVTFLSLTKCAIYLPKLLLNQAKHSEKKYYKKWNDYHLLTAYLAAIKTSLKPSAGSECHCHVTSMLGHAPMTLPALGPLPVAIKNPAIAFLHRHQYCGPTPPNFQGEHVGRFLLSGSREVNSVQTELKWIRLLFIGNKWKCSCYKFSQCKALFALPKHIRN